ncbi:hypothetical protein PF003_g37043 [Phytophthora fragariae]|nr:hypothetical protein PF003_g37043 [Phytophthora fragariae]
MPLIDDNLDVLGNAKLLKRRTSPPDTGMRPWLRAASRRQRSPVSMGLVMPLGLCNAIPAFERLMEGVQVDLKWRTIANPTV